MFQQPATVNQALATLLQQYQVHPVTTPVLHPTERLPLAAPVLIRVGRETVLAVVSGYNPNDMQRIRVSWFCRTEWRLMHRLVDQQMVARLTENQTAAVA